MSDTSKEAAAPASDHPTVVLRNESTANPSQDAYEALMDLLAQIDVSPTYARVDWATGEGEGEAPILVGRLTVTDTRKLNRALRSAAEWRNPPSILEDRPHRPLVGETVLDTATDAMGEVAGYVLRPLESGEPWTADPDNIRRPDRDRLIKARMGRLDMDRRANPSALVPALREGFGRE
ncbi:hypothetical protein ACFRI7_37870 [Streptomyces sp. NPDC056716]|uniref:hypothetical protein n=1 Tax=unclassified Streptomyces TaxID=2593676 RepID=UPI003683D541